MFGSKKFKRSSRFLLLATAISKSNGEAPTRPVAGWASLLVDSIDQFSGFDLEFCSELFQISVRSGWKPKQKKSTNFSDSPDLFWCTLCERTSNCTSTHVENFWSRRRFVKRILEYFRILREIIRWKSNRSKWFSKNSKLYSKSSV